MPNDTFEVQPLTDRLKTVLSCEGYQQDLDAVHFVRRVHPPDVPFGNDSRLLQSAKLLQEDISKRMSRGYIPPFGRVIIEVGVFFDEAAYKIFSPFFDNDDQKLVEMILAYMNAVQAIYHHSSLGIPIDISIVHIELMHKQPSTLPHHNGEREALLDSFCAYQKRLNPPGDDEPNHWDMGLYISGLDFYSYENGFNSGATMGLATVRGVCTPAYSCVIAEFGTTNAFRRPYPSAGFTSVYILAHEMGHNLGMAHDSTGNYCAKEGYIMSPSRGTQGETSWSSCSAQVARDLPNWATCLRDPPEYVPVEYNAWKYQGYPGQSWPAKRQCELLLLDKDAVDSPTNGPYSICQNLQCRSPHRSGYFFAGPALEGTTCGRSMWCEGGYCTPKKDIAKPAETVVPGGWSPWKTSKCASACIQKSKGFQTRRRVCDNPKPVNTNEGCDGSSYDVELCDDSRICRNIKRFSPITYASDRCRAFSRRLHTLDPRGYGLQAPHENNRLWMACAIFCRRANSLSYYTPRLELNDLGLDAYFPDGTWCHSDSSSNYYCQQHHCLPEGFQFGKFNVWAFSEDVPISNNANPNPMKPMNAKIRDYLSLDKFGKPLRTVLKPEDIDEIMRNEVWTDDLDYRDMPSRYQDEQYLVD
ncbi:A disintegrin and metalloproteinase with thrombospondin motifs adt-2-like isoform X2 [Hermetia illucens]|nr:A disintegrin and metalloproteinase with thrombospondin motifs adt-2-like isoform X2 [Hermetia illucens]